MASIRFWFVIFHRDAKWRSSFRSETSGNIAVCNYCTCSSQISKSRITLSCPIYLPQKIGLPFGKAWWRKLGTSLTICLTAPLGQKRSVLTRITTKGQWFWVVVLFCYRPIYAYRSPVDSDFCMKSGNHTKSLLGAHFFVQKRSRIVSSAWADMRQLLHLKRGCVPLIPWRGRLSIFWSLLSRGTISKTFQTRRFQNGCDAKLIYRHQLVSNCNWERFLSMTTFACLYCFTKMYKNGELLKLESYLTR